MPATNQSAPASRWKIDYDSCLGEGYFGIVYKIVRYPETEKSFGARYFPFLAASSQSAADSNHSNTPPLCIKIYKPIMFYLMMDLSLKRISFKQAVEKYRQREMDQEAYFLLREKGLTNVTFYESPYSYTQVKTIVNGRTFRHYIDNNLLSCPENRELRQHLIRFFQRIKTCNLGIRDLHAENLMYDKNHKAWDIIDAQVTPATTDNNDVLISVCYLLHFASTAKTNPESVWLTYLLAYLAIQDLPCMSSEADEHVCNTVKKFSTTKIPLAIEDRLIMFRAFDIYSPVQQLKEQLAQLPPEVVNHEKTAPLSLFFRDRPKPLQKKEPISLAFDLLFRLGLSITSGILAGLLSRDEGREIVAFCAALCFFCSYELTKFAPASFKM